MNLFFKIILLLFISISVKAGNDTINIPLNRQFFHDKINIEKRKCDKVDGNTDSVMIVGKNEKINKDVTDALFRGVNLMQEWVELNEKSNNDKIRELSYIEAMLMNFRISFNKKEIEGFEFTELVKILETILKTNDSSIIPFIEKSSYGIAKIISEVFADNSDYQESQKLIYLKYCKIHPENIITTIRSFTSEPFSDSLIYIACKNNPSKLYTYAQSVNTPEGRLIHKSNIPLVKTIATLSQLPNALMYFPFLDDLLSGKNSIELIQKFVGNDENTYDSVGYFKLLVKTEIDYHGRMTSVLKDTPIAMFGVNGLREVLKDRAIRHFINPINLLHNENNLDVRMHAIDSLSPVELYYMVVMGENEIYTSSFKHSFNRMMQRMGANTASDSLLLKVKFDYFKKFIKMAANYNKLDTFLRSMPLKNSRILMKAFVAKLEGPDGMEDATDVADSYSSITNPLLKKTILRYITENEKKCISRNNENGILVYGLLKNIFLSEDSSNKIDLTGIAGIPSVYEIDKKSLMDVNGRIAEQVFFYGDEDGKTYFPIFLNSFSSKDWKITQNPEWVEIRSVKGNVFIYANKPLDYDANLDDSAQYHLIEYLRKNDIVPTIVVHRGHSYWLQGTINRMPEDAKIVLIGSCGGYKNLNKILESSPNANIISTKEIGAGDINKPILNYINQALLNNNKISWREMWKSLSRLFNNDPNKSIYETWENYIPPYKNLGAIFIKAYNRKIEIM